MATLYGNGKNFRTQIALVAAKYGNAKVSHSDKEPPADKFPFKVVPAYTDGKKCLFGSGAIGWELCGEVLRGQTPQHNSQVIQWLSAAERDFLPSVLGWVLPSLSLLQHDKKTVEECRGELLKLMGILNDYLLSRTYLVGERLSIADIQLAFVLSSAYQHVLDGGVRKGVGNVNRWYNTVMHQIEVTQVAGTPQLCDTPAQFDAQKFKEFSAELESAQQAEGKKDKKGKGKSGGGDGGGTKKKEETPPAEELDETEMALAEEPKKKDPFEQFPKGTWNFDEFKRVYSNEDTETKALPYFWEHFDPENYSIWYCEYKFPKDLALVFMSCNLISGMFQRLDKMRKNAFGSMILFGENHKSTISGVWFWRGPQLAFELSSDWKVDFESYEWKKLDPKSPETKTLVQEYFTHEGKFGGKNFNQGKIFK